MTQRTNPFDTLERMFDRMSDQFQEAARSWESGDQLDSWTVRGDSMATDVRDDADEFVVTVDVPGFARDEIDVRVTDDVLSVEASHEETAVETDDERYIRRERAHRTLSRSLVLPEPVETGDVAATLDHGVLTITIPKAEPLDEGTAIDIEGE